MKMSMIAVLNNCFRFEMVWNRIDSSRANTTGRTQSGVMRNGIVLGLLNGRCMYCWRHMSGLGKYTTWSWNSSGLAGNFG